MQFRLILSAIVLSTTLTGAGRASASESYYQCEFYKDQGLGGHIGYIVKDLRQGERYLHFIGDTLLEALIDSDTVYTWIANHYGEPLQFIADSLVSFGTQNPNVKLELATAESDEVFLVNCKLK